jgi:REase_AHJR-like
MTTAEALVLHKTEELRAEYEARGFEVRVDPGPEEVPFDLDGFCPDLLARRHDANYLIVVRVGTMDVSVARLMDVVDEVRKHPGWHLTLVTADDVELVGAPGLDDALPSWPRLHTEVSRAFAMVHAGAESDAAFFVLWATLEGVLRKTAECDRLPIERLPTSAVLPGLFDVGRLSREQYDRLRSLLTLRNRVAHGFGASHDELQAAVKDLMALLAELLPHAVERAA